MLKLKYFLIYAKFFIFTREKSILMEKITITTVLTLFLAGALNISHAQDAVRIAGSVYQKLMENERVRLLKVDLQPEERTVTHFHPDHLLYVLEGGKMAITDTTGNAGIVDLASGDYHWFEAGKHSIVNIGTTTITGILVELKESEAMKPEE
jgi:beta-alanine degradation protein BauB